jgi:hypothetical protein
MNLVHGCVRSTWILDEYYFLSDHPICEHIQRDNIVIETETVTETTFFILVDMFSTPRVAENRGEDIRELHKIEERTSASCSRERSGHLRVI